MSMKRNINSENIIRTADIRIDGLDKFALIYFDIDNFKYLYETYGDIQCEEVIKCVEDHLIAITEKPQYVVRIAKDKFAVILTNRNSVTELYEVIESIINNGCDLYSSKNVFYITMSAGVVLYPEHGKEMATLMKKAETAIYYAKKTGKDINIYSDELQMDIIDQVQMVNKIQEGIEKEEFKLFYQPEYNLKTSKIIGAEALIRWHRPVTGYISPDVFIPIAENSKQIYAIERWVIQKALQQKEQWEREGLGHLELSINLSSKTLESESNLLKVEKILQSYNVDYSKIIFEITETFTISQVELVIERLNRLRNYGIRIALDDFGTGFSSLTHIMKLPIDIIKIDKSFIASLPKGNEEKAITNYIITLAHNLNLKVVAEGIETKEQLEYLKVLSCERGQGYLLCKPVPSDYLYQVLEKDLDL